MFYKSKHQRTCSEALLGSLVNEQVLQWQGLRQDIVTDVAASDAVTGCQKRSWRSEQFEKPEGVQGDGVPVLDRHLDRLQVGVHCHIHSSDRAMHLIILYDHVMMTTLMMMMVVFFATFTLVIVSPNTLRYPIDIIHPYQR